MLQCVPELNPQAPFRCHIGWRSPSASAILCPVHVKGSGIRVFISGLSGNLGHQGQVGTPEATQAYLVFAYSQTSRDGRRSLKVPYQVRGHMKCLLGIAFLPCSNSSPVWTNALLPPFLIFSLFFSLFPDLYHPDLVA